jgi:hypothetical protein
VWIDRLRLDYCNWISKVKRRFSLNQRGGRVVAAVTFKSFVQYRASHYIERLTRVLGAVGHRRENVLSIYIGRVTVRFGCRPKNDDRGVPGVWATLTMASGLLGFENLFNIRPSRHIPQLQGVHIRTQGPILYLIQSGGSPI